MIPDIRTKKNKELIFHMDKKKDYQEILELSERREIDTKNMAAINMQLRIGSVYFLEDAGSAGGFC